jgi:hypothetical protein
LLYRLSYRGVDGRRMVLSQSLAVN